MIEALTPGLLRFARNDECPKRRHCEERKRRSNPGQLSVRYAVRAHRSSSLP